jgi:hypothetical protein
LVSASFRFVAELGERVMAEGGPLDGTEIDLAGSPDEVAVEMADRSFHRYLPTSAVRLLQSGARGAVVRWAGRQ